MSGPAEETQVAHAGEHMSNGTGMHTQPHDLNHWPPHMTSVYTGSSDYPIPQAPYYPFSSNPYSAGQDQHTWGYAPHYQPQAQQAEFGPPPPSGPPFGAPPPTNYNFFDYSNTWNPANLISHTNDARGMKTQEYYQPRSLYAGMDSYGAPGQDLSRGMATLSIGGSGAALQMADGGHLPMMGGFGPVTAIPQGPPKALSWADKVKQPSKGSDLKPKRGPIGGSLGGAQPAPGPPQGLWNGPVPLSRAQGPPRTGGEVWASNCVMPVNAHLVKNIRRPMDTPTHMHENGVHTESNIDNSHSPQIDSAVLQQLKKDSNPADINVNLKGARFFVIKSYSEDDVHRSIKYGIWCSTEQGNKRLEAAWKERYKKGAIYLFYSVNASGHFCGMAEMISSVDYSKQSSVWAQDKWKGLFKVRWVYVKDVPNQSLRHIRLENNENKPVTNSRDTQEIIGDKGRQVLKLIHNYKHTTSLFDDFAHYEKRQEDDSKKRASSETNGKSSA